MVTMTTLRGNELTRDDLDALPDGNGRRYELLDGVIVMSAAPSPRHQGILVNLIMVLKQAAPPDFRVLPAPLDVALSSRTVLEPDIVVARRGDFTERDLPRAPALAVEILSPSTRRHDLGIKRDLLEEAGCGSYWVIDPGAGPSDPPSLTAWDLAEGRFVEVAAVAGEQVFEATRPFPARVVPGELLED